MQKVAVIGLDGVPPRFVFDEWRSDLPNLRDLMERGLWGNLRSCHPPITVPAWASMLTGRDPGELGIYGFRERRESRAQPPRLVNTTWVRDARVWDLLSDRGKDVLLLGVPPTYPPPPLRGHVVSCFLTPSRARTYTHPQALAAEVEAVVPDYQMDVDGFRDCDRHELRRRIEDKTRKHFQLARHLLRTKPWDFFMMVEMGPDRMHHAFWRYYDREHVGHVAGSDLADAMYDYYLMLDDEVGDLLTCIDSDAVVLVVSDHGAKRMDGGICLNEWLIANGYLVLVDRPAAATALVPEMIDWKRTRAWGEGGYCGRVFINLEGREPNGIVAAHAYEGLRSELIDGLTAIPSATGERLPTRVHRPEEVYRQVNGIAPDLIAYFGDLHWRALGSVGGGRIHARENDRGADDANHDWDGICILRDGRRDLGGVRLHGLEITDIAPTILHHAGIAAPSQMYGQVVGSWRPQQRLASCSMSPVQAEN